MKKKITLRSRFEDNYTTVTEPADNKKGYVIRYVYYAPWYAWQVPEGEFRKKKQLLAALEFFGVVLFLAAVLLRSPLNSTPWVVFPTALAFCAQLMELSGMVDFLSAKPRTTQIRYEDIQRRLMFYPTIRAVLLLIAVLAAVGLLASGAVTEGVWILPGLVLCAALAWQVQSMIRGIPMRIEDNDAMAKIVAKEKQDAEVSQ